jgi:hypothetical protein
VKRVKEWANGQHALGTLNGKDLDVRKMRWTQGLLGFGATDEELQSGAFFDFVECFSLTLLSMGTITVEHRGSRLDTPPTRSILLPCTAEIETKP